MTRSGLFFESDQLNVSSRRGVLCVFLLSSHMFKFASGKSEWIYINYSRKKEKAENFLQSSIFQSTDVHFQFCYSSSCSLCWFNFLWVKFNSISIANNHLIITIVRHYEFSCTLCQNWVPSRVPSFTSTSSYHSSVFIADDDSHNDSPRWSFNLSSLTTSPIFFTTNTSACRA